jgi:sulfopyruvate decarboxylase TPP-binding subunit
LKEEVQRKISQFLMKKEISSFIGVPDSTLKFFIDEGLKKKKVIIANREDEAIGIAVGMTLANKKSCIFMQNAGFANSVSTITSLVQLYEIPLLIVVGWRGFLKNDAPEHRKIGQIQNDLFKLLSLESRVLTEKNWKKTCEWALKRINNNSTTILVIARDFLD